MTGGTRVLSDWIVVRVTAEPGETFVDRMIAMVEERGAKDPNEVALTIPAAGADPDVLLVAVTLLPFSHYQRPGCRRGEPTAGRC